MPTYLPSSGPISLNDINNVFGRGLNLNAYRGTTYYTSTAGPFTFSSGAISMSSFYGTGPTANITYTVATGGTITTSGNYKIHTFTGGGTFTVNQVGTDSSASYLIVAGGGGGGGRIYTGGGGGGAGGLLTGNVTLSATNYGVGVGGGQGWRHSPAIG